RWTTELHLSFLLAGHLIFIGELTRDRYAHALGLMARGDALRHMDQEVEAITYLDAAAEEFLAEGDEVGWARSRIGRVNDCLELNRSSEALRDAAAALAPFVRHNTL